MPTSTIAAKARPLPAGVYCPVITLYKNTPLQEIDLDAMYKHCQYLVRGGQHGLVYLGTNGELALLDREERKQILVTARRAVTDLGVPNYPLVAGISAQGTKETVQLAQDAADAGASFALLLPPSYWAKSVTEEALLGYYRDVADRSPLPVVCYNFPGVTSGVDLDSDQLSALAAHPNIVGVKLTCGNVGKVVRLASKFSPSQFGVYGGSSDYLVPTLEAGGVGCVTGLANVFPRATARIFDLWQAGKKEEAARLQQVVANAEWACKKSLAATKFGAWWFVGRKIGLEDAKAFAPRKPYLETKEAFQKWTVETMSVLEADEAAIPEGIKGL
ncbi:Dihydrodipicolinate synthetase-like protein [Lasiodiplodia theobromae]|uniref:Putative 4-hydroxy-2-oxoglutarate aldolase n=1 Tax=Lasiodiplodia theobromae TaxID=45133 RepID=A0A5N5DDX8_9PEZI|nr:putative 4-hydroxy-2-oxoglutarate aldolase [Lasiodiplodia theobromae]KAF9632926.1 Dihydrodipicolinate synthetase-like protein [Lasiodiplodia theobromae]